MNLAGYPVPELVALVAGLLVTGVVAGTLAGLLGVGGGIVIVPVLYQVFALLKVDPSIAMKLAVGTSLGTIILTSMRSVRSHHKKGAVDWALLRRWALPVLLGVGTGTVVAASVSSRGLTFVFATMALFISANFAFGKESWRLGDKLPSRPAQYVFALVMGGLSAMMGIGGGTFGVSYLTLYGKTPREAVATSSGLGLLISVPGVLGFVISGWGNELLPPLSLGYVNLIGMALIVPLTIFTAPYGAKIAHTISHKALIRTFALFLFISSCHMFYRLLIG